MEVQMKNTHKSFAVLMVAVLLLSATVSGFAQTPAVVSKPSDTATTKTRQRFAAKTTDEKTSVPNIPDATKRQGKRGSEPDEVKPTSDVATNPQTEVKPKTNDS